ncbi:hypothetical protein EON63_17040, partial [archaeon]
MYIYVRWWPCLRPRYPRPVCMRAACRLIQVKSIPIHIHLPIHTSYPYHVTYFSADQRIPLSVRPVLPLSFAIFNNQVLLDPTHAEQQVLLTHPQGGGGTLVMDPHGTHVHYLCM